MQVARLHPDPAIVDLETELSGLDLAARAPSERPYLVLNMVSTADGKATIEGRTRKLGGEADTLLFKQLRTQADAVMAGAETVRVERYGPIVKDEASRQKRRDEGLEADPLAVIVSGSLALPTDLPLLLEPQARVVIATTSSEEIPSAEAQVDYVRAPGPSLGLPDVMRRLRTDHGVRSILCEGGPTLNDGLLREGLVDELFLTVTPLVRGGGDPLTIVAGRPLPEPAPLELVSALHHESELCLRYRVAS